jgi:uncharacterized membrane protein YgcG
MARNSISVRWVVSPSTLTPAIEDYADTVETALMQLAQDIAIQAQAEMKQDAPWTDRTGNARRGLFAQAVQINVSLIRIYLSHGPDIDYGKWLELRHGGRFAIVEPTWQQYISIVEREVKRRLAQ